MRRRRGPCRVASIQSSILSQSRTGSRASNSASVRQANAELTRTLGRVLQRPTLLPLPAFVAKLVLGEVTGQRLRPTRLLEAGFEFAYPELEGALRQALAR